jgi:glycosyltransferase involved in cell wall biosynthesis
MKVILYESSSKGGCYEYAHYLQRAFLQKETEVILLVPENSGANPLSIHSAVRLPILLNDASPANKWIAKLAFLYRQFVNPMRFLIYLSRQPASIVIWNDFEQLTAPVWTLLLRCIAAKHTHTIVLHDPDRDNYPPSKWYSEWCMNSIMRVMQTGYYHGYLPQKKYYSNTGTRYVPIVHGVFDKHSVDADMYNTLMQDKGTDQFITILGNIREEKNYRLIIESLKHLSGVKLLIAGAPANSSVNIEELKALADQCGVAHKISWHIKFLTDQQLAACIEASDILLLYYQKQFTSQSGILNLIAPYQKKFVYSDMESGLGNVCRQYGIGIPCPPDSPQQFVQSIESILTSNVHTHTSEWTNYLKNADWTSMYESLQRNEY